MKLIIDIPEDCLEDLNNIELNYLNDEVVLDILCCVRNGIPLPKGHGDLIDADKMIKELNEHIQIFDERKNEILKQLGEPEENNQIPLWMWKGCCKTCGMIIEADKGE